jgi:hypothetical protein
MSTPSCPTPKPGFTFLLVAGKPMVVALFDVSLVVEAMNPFAAGKTLLARRS